MNENNVSSTDSYILNNDISTSELKTIPISTEQEVLPLNKNKPWRLIIRRNVADGRSGDKSI